jgi:hypothetical protein
MSRENRSGLDLGPCRECSEYLVDIGFAPHCPGCDRELLLGVRAGARAVVGPAAVLPVLPVEAPDVLGAQPLSELVDLRR